MEVLQRIFSFVVILEICIFSLVFGEIAKIVKELGTQQHTVGDQATLDCVVSNLGTDIVFWERLNPGYLISHNKVIRANNKNTDDTESGSPKYVVERHQREGSETVTYSLLIADLTAKDEGRYRCYVGIRAVHVSQWPRMIGTLKIQVPPMIFKAQSTDVLEVQESQPATLRCAADGTPKPTISWQRPDGQDLQPGIKKYMGPKYRITAAKSQDAGVYRCVADNGVEPAATHDVRLMVFHAPRVIMFFDEVGQAIGGATRFECSVEGYPLPEIRWIKVVENQWIYLEESEKFEMAITPGFQGRYASLKIASMEQQDYGVYVCEGTNVYGKDHGQVVVYETDECQGLDCPTTVEPVTEPEPEVEPTPDPVVPVVPDVQEPKVETSAPEAETTAPEVDHPVEPEEEYTTSAAEVDQPEPETPAPEVEVEQPEPTPEEEQTPEPEVVEPEEEAATPESEIIEEVIVPVKVTPESEVEPEVEVDPTSEEVTETIEMGKDPVYVAHDEVTPKTNTGHGEPESEPENGAKIADESPLMTKAPSVGESVDGEVDETEEGAKETYESVASTDEGGKDSAAKMHSQIWIFTSIVLSIIFVRL